MKETEFLELIERHKGILHKICFSYSNSNEEFKDLMQEMLLQLWKSHSGFKGQSSFSTWMYKVALFTALAHVRSKKPELSSNTIETTSNELDPYAEKDELEVLKLAIKSLPGTDRAVLLLYLEDKGYREMSEILGLSESNVGVKLNRIKQKLKDKMIRL